MPGDGAGTGRGKRKDQTLTLAKRNSGKEGDGAHIETSVLYTERKVRGDPRASFTLLFNYLFSHLGTVFSALHIKINETDLYPVKLPSKHLI